jgi:AcrR family transcriptional regulator
VKDSEILPPRADAAREIYAAKGPDAPLEAVARRARVGIRTLYRRIPIKAALTRAALEQSISDDGITPSLERVAFVMDAIQRLAL